MFGFEKNNKIKPEVPKDESESGLQDKPKNITLLQKIRNHSEFITPALQGMAFGTMVVGGKRINDDIIEHQQEVRAEAKEAYKYLREDFDSKQDSSKIVNDDFISEIALLMKNDHKIESLIKCRSSLKSVIRNPGCEISKSDSVNANKQMLKYNSEIDNKKKELSEKDKKAAKEKVMDLISLVEKTKIELIKHFQSNDYLEKLAKEMDISKEAAKEHQKVRVANVNNLKYEFKNSAEIFMDTDSRTYAYYSILSNSISLPYDIDFNDQEAKNFFCEAIFHEIAHGSTMASVGMSNKSQTLLNNCFMINVKEDSFRDAEYYSLVEELIVRKQFLDKWMEDNGFKKYDEKFTEKHFKKLLELQKENKLPSYVDQLINHIKPEYFIDIMNELAMIRKKDKTYHLSELDYNVPEDKA